MERMALDAGASGEHMAGTDGDTGASMCWGNSSATVKSSVASISTGELPEHV